MTNRDNKGRHLGLWGATGVGVGAIVGGGILALSGAAYAATGPSAVLAFALNGIIALLTALSFAEMASKFPESGGTYTFAKKVLSVDSAFMVGWVVWFASIVAAVLYAFGFSYFFLVMLAEIWSGATGQVTTDWTGPRAILVVAVVTTTLLTVLLLRSPRSGGAFANFGKVFVFIILILGGFWALTQETPADVWTRFTPFFSKGGIGLIQAMGFTFIALQGFDLIAAVGGEVRQPSRNIPRAMLMSLGIALAIYLPLLVVIAVVGVSGETNIFELANENSEDLMAVAAERFLGPFGYWLVIIAAVLSMFSALQANMFAASRIANAMAKDRNLPAFMAQVSQGSGTPTWAIFVTSLLMIGLLTLLPDVSSAGAASSLIFLLTFALAHWAAIRIRQRSHAQPPPFRTPWFPGVPMLGGVSCMALAIFQGIAVPSAGLISIAWLAIGLGLFLGIFARRARVKDATSAALEPELLRLRGESPLVLTPIANPRSVEALLSIAHALVPPAIGRVVALTVAKHGDRSGPANETSSIDRSQEVMGEVLRSSGQTGEPIEVMTTLASDPMVEIARVARLHQCQTVLIGMGELTEQPQTSTLETLFASLASDLVVLRVPNDWSLNVAKKILVPVAGRGGHDHLLARFLGSLTRENQCHVTFMHVANPGEGRKQRGRIERQLSRLADDILLGQSEVLVVESEDPVERIARELEHYDLTILGMQRDSSGMRVLSDFMRTLAGKTADPLVVISSKRPNASHVR
ncbi:MAG: amino acid permease [Planctomycetota bacterium]|nr:amino acid permease [Planctomycetota bacterium]MEC8431779.1 amino acid permease [Planctomycetota bacterium]